VLVFDGEGQMISAVTDAAGERLTQPVGVAVSPGGDVLFTDVGRDAVLEYTPSIPSDLQVEAMDEEDVGATPRP
jgi:hypothetical protein